MFFFALFRLVDTLFAKFDNKLLPLLLFVFTIKLFVIFEREFVTLLNVFITALVAVFADGILMDGMTGTGTDPVVKKDSIPKMRKRIIARIMIAGA